MLVPEIALTPAVAGALPAGLRRARGHSAQRAVRRRAARPVAAHPPRRRSTSSSARDRRCSHRSASSGSIVVDEEHDSSYKQEESPRYNGRDVAIVRAQRAGALVVLGSATPSMESYHNAMSGQVRARRARTAGARPAARRGHRRRHARGVRRRRAGRGAQPGAARRARGAARAARAGARAAEPARVRDRRVLPPVRRHDRLPELQRVAGRARRGRGAARPLPLLQLLGARAERLPAVCRRRTSSRPASAPSGSRPR